MTQQSSRTVQLEPGTQLMIPQIAEETGYSEGEITIYHGSPLGKGLTLADLAYFLKVCKMVDLNPFVKEMWAYKDYKGNLIVFAGRDGFVTKAQRDPRYGGIRSSEVRENDEFEINIPEGKVNHKINKTLVLRGKLIGAYAFAFRKEGQATLEWVDYNTYFRGGKEKSNPWDTHPAAMIKKVAETHACKLAFGISGLQSEYDFDIKNNIAIPIQTEYSEQLKEKTLLEKIEGCKTPEEVVKLWEATDPKERKPFMQQFVDRGHALGAKDKKPEEKPQEKPHDHLLVVQDGHHTHISPEIETAGGKRLLTKDEVKQCLVVINHESFADKDGVIISPTDWFKSITESRVISKEDYLTILAALDKYMKKDGKSGTVEKS